MECSDKHGMHSSKARHLGGSAYCNFQRLEVPEQTLGGIPLGFRIVVDEFSRNGYGIYFVCRYISEEGLLKRITET